MPLQQTSGNATTDAYGGGVAIEPNYIESCFSTYLYTGTSGAITINNGIDLSTKGGLVWTKGRTAWSNYLEDTVRGKSSILSSDLTGAAINSPSDITSFNTTGYSLGYINGSENSPSTPFVSWTFRKQPKFFDVVTYTGDGTANRSIAHSINGTVGAVFIKKTNGSSNWNAACRLANGNASFMMLNRTEAQHSSASSWFSDTTFLVGTSDWPSSYGPPNYYGFDTNNTGDTYVAYIYAHNAGGFGLTGTDNVISCGSMAGAAGTTVTLGYEPQFVMYKASTTTGNWIIADTMRGFTANGGVAPLRPNLSDAEGATTTIIAPNATGFSVVSNLTAGQTYIYIAIRRGPMKVPTDATKVFTPATASGSTSAITVTAGFPTDMLMIGNRGVEEKFAVVPRLIGQNAMKTWSTAAESATLFGATTFSTAQNSVYIQNGDNITNASAQTYVDYMFKRAPSFFDVVCYKGQGGGGQFLKTNLQANAELIIVKPRSTTGSWYVAQKNVSPNTEYWTNLLRLNTTDAVTDDGTNLTGGGVGIVPANEFYAYGGTVDGSGITYVAYLFATCANVSKVGTYTGTGATQTINCGFGASGSRFVLIKRTDSTGDWYVWDSARGMVSGTDPSLKLNTTAAEVNANSVYAVSTGFQIVSTAAGINASGGSYIFLSVA
jgi:hypothetical protein